jgi:uncharacterized glyoxalase superfamily protein PhnB
MADEQTFRKATDERGEPVNLGNVNGFEIYPMPMFATIATADVPGLVQWYRDALGFGEMFSMPGPAGPLLVHLRRKKYQDVLVVPAAPRAAPASGPAPLTITFQLDQDAATFAERARSVPVHGSSAVTGPVDTPWNTTDVRVTDPVGNRLVFTSARANRDPEVSKRMNAMFDAAKQR